MHKHFFYAMLYFDQTTSSILKNIENLCWHIFYHSLLLNYFYCKPEQIRWMHLFLQVLQLQQMLNKCYSMQFTNRHGNHSAVTYVSFGVQYMSGMNGHTSSGRSDEPTMCHVFHTAAVYMSKTLRNKPGCKIPLKILNPENIGNHIQHR